MANYQSAVEQIKSSINIVDVINPLVPLKRAGSNLKACCPFHKEKTPSFVVNEARGTYYCFGCGEHGDVIKFIEKYYNLNFLEAVERLAQQYGITIERSGYASDKANDAYYEANKLAARFFFDNLRNDANKGFGYLKQRGMNPETMNDFGIGWAPDEWSAMKDELLKKGVKEKTLEELGLISVSSKDKTKTFDKFRSRVIFPIINTRDKVIGFGGRIVGEGEPKYLNSSESAIFLKKNNLYGLNKTKSNIQKEGYAILVEGYMDCVSLYQYGVKNVVASLGTALTEGQARLLSRYTKKVVLCYDADAAGIRAAERGIAVLREINMEVRVLHVDDGKDPDDYIKKHGKDAFIDLVENKSVPDVDYRVGLLKKNYNLNDTTQGIKFLKGVADILKTLSPVEADVYISKFSQQYKISAGALKREMVNRDKSVVKTPVRTDAGVKEDITEPKPEPAELKLERMIIKLIMSHSDYYGSFAEYPEAFVSDSGFVIKEIFDEKYREGEDFDFDDLKNLLDDGEYVYLNDIINNVQTGDDSIAFKDCIDKLQDGRRNIRLKEIEEILHMADSLPEERINNKKINDLMNEYQMLQLMNRGKK